MRVSPRLTIRSGCWLIGVHLGKQRNPGWRLLRLSFRDVRGSHASPAQREKKYAEVRPMWCGQYIILVPLSHAMWWWEILGNDSRDSGCLVLRDCPTGSV